jgi:hypothetical protein
MVKEKKHLVNEEVEEDIIDDEDIVENNDLRETEEVSEETDELVIYSVPSQIGIVNKKTQIPEVIAGDNSELILVTLTKILQYAKEAAMNTR